MAKIYTPNSSPIQGSTRPLDETRCKAEVYRSNGGWSTFNQCTRKPVKDGWCKQHSPDAEKSRADAAVQKREAEDRRHAMGWYGERFMAALIKIRDGDNDPRETARAALDKISYAKPETKP